MKQYLIVYDGENFYVNEAVSIHDLISKFADYTGYGSDLFKKAISGLDYDDIYDFVNMYNHFSNYRIDYVYEINKELYNCKTTKQIK